jgi:hypothetical protein
MAKIFIFLLMAFSLVNFRISFLSLSDLLLSAGLLSTILFKKDLVIPSDGLFIFSIFITLYIFSGFFSGGGNSASTIIFFGFLYKYFFIFGLYLLVQNVEFSVVELNKTILFCWMAILLWTLYYVLIVTSDSSLSTSLSQLSFPGTNTLANPSNDSHLFAYISGGLGLYLFLYLQNMFKYFIGLATLFIILVTGSRNPLALYIILFCLFFALGSKKQLFYLVLSVLCGAGILIFNFEAIDNFLPSTRSFNFNFYEDSSANNRIAKLMIAIKEFLSGSMILGQSVFNSKILWADGIHTILIIHFGFFGLFFYLSMLTYFLARLFFRSMNPDNAREKRLLFFSCYVLFGLFITEFVLTSRGAVLALIPLFYLIKDWRVNTRLNLYSSQSFSFHSIETR